MRIPGHYILLALSVFLLLVAGNIYQLRNPRVVTIPGYKQQQIDSTTWVLRSRYQRRGQVLDSLKRISRNLAGRIRKSHNQVAAYTQIVGRLKTRIDSLQSGADTVRIRPDLLRDTTLAFSRIFGNHLFRVDSKVHFRNWQVWDELSLNQMRPIKLNVVTTVEPHRRYVLTYVNSPDFDSLRYRSVTTLKYHKRLPGFLLGSAATLLALGIVKFVLH